MASAVCLFYFSLDFYLMFPGFSLFSDISEKADSPQLFDPVYLVRICSLHGVSVQLS